MANTNTFTGDGTTTSFYFTFSFFGTNDIKVSINNVAQSTNNFTIYPNATPGDAPDIPYTGGRIDFAIAPANNDVIKVWRDIEINRHIDYQPTSQPQSHQLNQDLNQCVEILKELTEKISNVISLSNIPNVAELLSELTTINNKVNDCVTTETFSTLNTTVGSHTTSIDALNGYDSVVEFQLPNAENNYTWYRKYKSGWVEQGGYHAGSGTWAIANITLPIEMSNACYTLTITGDSSNNDFTSTETLVKRAGTRSCVCNRSTTGFGCQSNTNISWHVYGIPA